jgi:hypothetical protein
VQFQTLMLSTIFTGILGVMGFHALKVGLCHTSPQVRLPHFTT